MSVSGWVSRPGAELGTNRFVPGADDLPASPPSWTPTASTGSW